MSIFYFIKNIENKVKVKIFYFIFNIFRKTQRLTPDPFNQILIYLEIFIKNKVYLCM